MILQGKTAVVVGGGQTPGATIGNGRATAMQFAREGAEVLVADRDLGSAGETVVMIEDEGGRASACHVDVTEEASLQELSREVLRRYGKVDVLHNNVGMSLAAGDAAVEDITTDAFDRIVDINLRGMVLACKHFLPAMREAGSGAIVNISSMAAWRRAPRVKPLFQNATSVCRSAERWAQLGTSRTRRLFSHRIVPDSSPAWHCLWTAGRA